MLLKLRVNEVGVPSVMENVSRSGGGGSVSVPNPRAVSKEELPPRNGKVVVVSETPAAAPEDKENAEAAAEPSNAIEDDRYAIPTEG